MDMHPLQGRADSEVSTGQRGRVPAPPVGLPPRWSGSTGARCRRFWLWWGRPAPVAAAIFALLIASGPASPAAGQEKSGAPYLDAGLLSEIAQDVIDRAAAGSAQPKPEPSSPQGAPEQGRATSSARDQGPAMSHPPGRQGINVSAPATASPPKHVPVVPGADGYKSNSWRQAPVGSGRALSFSSGVFTPPPGLDPELKAQADRARGGGRDWVYGFALLQPAPEEKLERALGRYGVRLLGPHDGHHKVRVPIASLDAVARLAEVEWLGVSLPEQKVSLELAEVADARARGIAGDSGAGLPIVVNLFEGDEGGSFRRQLEAAGAVVGEYDARLHFYRAVATPAVIDRIVALDFVLFVELIRPVSSHHSQSTPLVDADMIRPGGSWGVRYSGAATTVGILDTGFMLGGAAVVPHVDLNKWGCGVNFTTDAAGVWDDPVGHGTHVLATIAGTGTGQSRYTGVAPGVGSIGTQAIRAGKILPAVGLGMSSWMESGMDFMSLALQCGAQAPLVINVSAGTSGVNQAGTDSVSRKLDDWVWSNHQVYVVSAGNEGPNAGTVGSPGVAKNALTVGNVLDNRYLDVGDVANLSSRGPTGDNRMKPNVVAPGSWITSAAAGTADDYVGNTGTSMAAPHVTGMAATLMEHYPEFQGRPALLRAWMMATAIPHNDVPEQSNDYGLGRVSSFLQHWGGSGWQSQWFHGTVSSTNWQYGDITVPAGAQRLVVVLTWDEPAASSGASQAVTYDVDLWVDYLADCNEPIQGWCGDYRSISSRDNVEYVVVNNPPAGLYRIKASNYRAPAFALPYGMAAMVVTADTTPAMTATLTAPATVVADTTFPVTVWASTPTYVASGVQVQMTSVPSDVELVDVTSAREDGVTMSLHGGTEWDFLTLGNVFPGISRSGTWWFRARTTGTKTFTARVWSENGGTVNPSATTQALVGKPNLSVTNLTLNPARPTVAPGGTFQITDTTRNGATGAAGVSTTRHYLGDNLAKDAGDSLIGTRAVPSLAAFTGNSGTLTATVPATLALGTYYVVSCADDLSVVDETKESDNCTSAGPVTVTRPDLVETSVVMTPTAPVVAPGGTFSVTDIVKNQGGVAAGASTTRYWLSLDVVRGGDTLAGSRAVPGLAAGAQSQGTVTLTVPATLAMGQYFLFACADDLGVVVETNEASNCALAQSRVTVTRADLAVTAVTLNPTSPVRAPGQTFTITDTVQNFGTLPSVSATVRYYLSLNVSKDAGDTLLTGSRVVPALAAFVTNQGPAVTVTIPATTPLNTYFVLACADDLGTMVETNEGNNCNLATTGTVTVTRPDLVVTSVTTTPASPARAPGTTFQVTDTTRNNGSVASLATTVRYYLSLNGAKPGATLLTGTRVVAGLAPGASSPGAAVTVTIPAATTLATYYLLACADDLSAVVETNEANNCTIAAGLVTVSRADLVEDAVSNPPTTKVRGTSFTLTDTARNAGAVAAGAMTVRYYLSLNGAKAGATLLSGSRAVPALAAGAVSASATVTVTIPSTTPTNAYYYLVACADDLSVVVETGETNNCRASATRVLVTP